MRIGIDFDETVADSIKAIIALHNEQYGTDYKKEEVTEYRVENVWGGTTEEWGAKLDDFLSAKNAKRLDPVPGAIPAIDALKSAGHELYIVTARGDEGVEATELWLEKHLPATFKGVHYGHGRSDDPAKKREKADICRELGVELMIEDHIEVAKKCAAEGTKVLLLDQPWNQGALPPGVERVYSWEEIVKKLL